MKTSEFVQRMEDIDLLVVVRGSSIEVYYNIYKIMVVQRNELWGIDTRFHRFNKIPENIKKVAITEAIEYINTPVEEREEPKKYYLPLPKEYTSINRYLNYNKIDDEYGFYDGGDTDVWKTQFTQEEIENLPRQDFIKTLDRVPVNEEEK